MSRIVVVYEDPFNTLAQSVVTSNTLDLRDALAWSLSWRTTSGTTSVYTIQISNSSVQRGIQGEPTNATFLDYQTFGTASKGAMIFGDPAARYARILRLPSGASLTVDFNKQVG